ncbi:SLBB domain-containing protein [Noviherbaspirillum autotrophicum]|uniref:SLBB domain-containing protein n=1 Tax=Noviherbaspirillum autotrophicum TaxID=709839 RepID=UPI0018DFAF5B|nr:SLBB domain-containing protein [Noviherbaspirillum autotrophicum]
MALAATPSNWPQDMSNQATAASANASQGPTIAAGTTGLPRISNTGADARVNGEMRVQQGMPPYPLPKREKSTFAIFVEKVAGTSLEIFGTDLFVDAPSNFTSLNGVPVNADYIVGPGDELQIRGWGMVDIDLSATVDRSGAIYIPRVGSVRVAGVKYRDLQGHLKKAIGKNFSNFELTASISQARSVQVYVVGHAARPGTYTLNAMSTLLNALFTSGGPDASGSMRNIQVKRGDATITTFDVYDMLVKGDKSRDVPLQDGDVVYIPEVGPLVALTGNVKRPSIFELKGQSSLADLMAWAGGFDSATESKQVVVEKNVNNNYQVIADLIADNSNAGSRLAGIPLQPADVLRVFSPGAVPVQAQVRNEYVRVSGEIKQSGVFQLRKGETLRALIARLGGITEDGYLYAMQLTRESVRRAQQAKLNEVADRFERDIESNAKQRLAGTTDKENIAAVNAELERQRQLAQKMRSIKAEGRIVLELSDADAQVKNLPDLELQGDDAIYVPRKPGTVDVMGAVFQQSAFIFKPQRIVNDYLGLAGGPTATADTSEIYLLHADGTAQSSHSSGWFGGLGGARVNPGDAVVVPEKIDRNSWTQSVKEWTTILYQFGLGAAGLKVLKN